MSDPVVVEESTPQVTDSTPASTPVESSTSVESTSPPVRDTATLAREAFAAASREAADSQSAAHAVPTPPGQAPIVPGEGSATPVTPPQGPIPFDRHKAVLTERDNKFSALQQRYQWVDQLGLPAHEVTQAAQLAQILKRDPEGFLRIVQSQIQPPQGGQMSAPGDDMPLPDIDLNDGRSLYSKEQNVKLLEWQRKQTLAEVEKTYGPMRQRHEIETLRATNQREAGSWLREARAEWPMFSELEEDIKAAIAADPNDPTPSSFRDAYIRALRDVGLKRQQDKWETDRVAQLQKKASAGSMQPGIPRPTSPKPNSQKSIEELTREAFARAR